MPSFPQFALLHPEIQLIIWAFSLPPPRIVDLFAVPVSESLQLRPRFGTKNCGSTSPASKSISIASLTPDALEENTVPAGASAAPPVWIHTFIERIYSTPQNLSCLHICSASRQVALKRYVRVNADMELCGDKKFEILPSSYPKTDEIEAQYYLSSLKGSRPYALLDPSHDIVFLQDPPRTLDRTGGLVISSLDILLRWSPVPVSSLKRLAVPYFTWRKTRNNGRLVVLRELVALEELFVSFLGDGYAGSGYRASWSDVVGAVWSHVEEVEEEVRADVEVLKRECPEWKVPRVRVVRHRGVLGEELGG
jgi:hypothetical protein